MEMGPFETLDVAREGGILVLTLNRPDHLNAFDERMHAECEAVFPRIAADRTIRAVVVTGAGRAFSAGGDIKGMVERTRDLRRNVGVALQVPAQALRLFGGLLDIPQPTIAAVNGDAVGLGATIALACDVSVMAEGARLGDTHVRAGLVAGDGGAVIWPLLVGPNRAKDFLMRGRLVKGAEAERMGLVNECVPAGEALPRARAIAEELAALAPWAVQWTKLSVNKGIKDQLARVFDASIAFEALSMLTADHAEAARGFLEKRKPTFTGE